MKKKTKFKLEAPFTPKGDQIEAIRSLTENFLQGTKQQTLLGVTGSGKTFTMANVIAHLQRPTLILAHNKTLAAQLYAEFKEFFPHNAVEYFVSYYDYYRPEAYVVATDIYVEKESAINDQIDKLRHSATRSLLEREDVIVIASVSCIYGIGSPVEYESLKKILFLGDEIEREEFLKYLVKVQYERNDIDFSRGKFRQRGDIVEIFPAHEESRIIRLEFFDTQLEKILEVDPLTGEILTSLDHLTIYPKSHYAISEEKLKKAIVTIREELRERLNELERENKLVEKQRLEQRTLQDLEMLEQVGFCSGIENYSRHMTGTLPGEPPPTLIDYFKEDFLLIVDESHITLPQVGGMYEGDRSRKLNLVNFGFRLPSALDNRPLNFKEFEKKIDRVLYVSATPSTYEIKKTQGEFVEQVIRPTGLLDPEIEVRSAHTQVEDLRKEIEMVVKKGFRVLITSLTKKLAEELTTYYVSKGLKAEYLHSDIEALKRVEILNRLREGEIEVLVGINLLREGLDLPEVALVAILDADKEGFLRSEKSLIQTIGRAARNSEGRVILYAYEETESMKKAIRETLRRRKIQEAYNKEHNITPKTITKSIKTGILDILTLKEKKKGIAAKRMVKVSSLAEIEQKIVELTNQMRLLAKNLHFEEAAELRDQIKTLKQIQLELF